MRISGTDRCNRRCKYCIPHDLSLIRHEDILRYEEIIRISEIAAKNGVRHLKITGGEPLARRGCTDLIRALKKVPGIEHVTITTNGVLLYPALPALYEAGIDGINISLDTLNPKIYEQITGRDEFHKVWTAFEEAVGLGLKVKINCVPIQGYNEKEYLFIAELAKNYPVDVRFIEMMPIGYGKDYSGIKGNNILTQILTVYPDLTKSGKKRGYGPASYFTGPSLKGSIGFIEAINHKFCSRCNRIRLTADGYLKTCLYYKNSVNLKKALRDGATDKEISALFLEALEGKPKEHHFGQQEEETEERKMSQIGG